MHFSGVLEGVPMAWGYVEGGMGRISFAIAEAARDAGAVLVAGVPVGEILPGEGVRLAGGELVRAPVVVSNADPKVTVDAARRGCARRHEGSGRLVADREPGAEGELRAQPPADVDSAPRTTTIRAARRCRSRCRSTRPRPAFEACTARRCRAPASRSSTSRRAYDPTVAPTGKHTMSAFVQYAPYTLAEGDWDTRRDEIGRRVIDLIARFAPDIDVVRRGDRRARSARHRAPGRL